MNIWLGFLFVLVGAICGGSFALPSKFVKKDTPWETLWGPFFLFVTVLIPTTLGPVLVRGFFGIYGALEARALLPVRARDFGDVVEHDDAGDDLSLRVADRSRVGDHLAVIAAGSADDGVHIGGAFPAEHGSGKREFLGLEGRAVRVKRLPL